MAKQEKNKNKSGKFLAALLGFLFGIITCLGGLFGAGYYIAKKKTPKDLFSFTPWDYSSYLTEEYATKTVWNMIGDTVSVLRGFKGGKGTLAELAAISPMVSKKVDAFAKSVKETYGVDLNKDGALMTVPLNGLNAHIYSSIENTPASDLFSKFGEGNKVLTALCYGVEGEDYILVDGKPQPLGDKKPMLVKDFAGADLKTRLDSLPLDTVMSVKTNDKTACALAYGESNHYTVEKDGIVMNQRKYTLVSTTESKTFYDEEGKLVECTALEISENVYKLTFADESVQYLSKNAYVPPQAEEEIQPQAQTDSPFFYVYSNESCNAPVRYKKTTIGDLEADSAAVINRIALKDVLNVTPDSHSMLIALACGEVGTDFDYVYDQTTGNKIDFAMKNPARTIGDLRNNSKGLIDDIYLTSLISPQPQNKVIMYLLYGRKGVHYGDDLDGDGNPDMLQKQVAVYENNVYNEYGEVIANAKANGLTYTQFNADGETELASYKLAQADKTIKITIPPVNEGEKATKLTVPAYYVFNTDDTKVYYTRTQMRDMTGDSKILASLTDRLHLTDVMDVEDNKILKHLTNVTIAELPEEINNLSVGQVFDEDMHFFDKETGKYYTDASKTTEVDASQKYLALKPTWKYLIRANTADSQRYSATDLALAREGKLNGVYYYEDAFGHERYYDYRYKVTTDMNTMVKNIEHNMQYTPLTEMNADGIIEGDHSNLILKPISPSIKDASDLFDGYNYLGDLTINQMLDYVNLYIDLKESNS